MAKLAQDPGILVRLYSFPHSRHGSEHFLSSYRQLEAGTAPATADCQSLGLAFYTVSRHCAYALVRHLGNLREEDCLHDLIRHIWSHRIRLCIGEQSRVVLGHADLECMRRQCDSDRRGRYTCTSRLYRAIQEEKVARLTASLQADIYDPQERGMKLGIYYLFPVLGPSVGTLLGGALSLAKPQWRTTFWFMFAYCVLVFAWSIFFQDTFRKERSLAWRAAYARAMKAASLKDRALEHPANQAARLGSGAPGKELSSGTGIVSFPVEPSDSGKKDDHDSDYLPTSAPSNPNQQLGKSGSALAKVVTATGESIPIKVSMRDVK